MSHNIEIGAYETKRRLSAFLRQVQSGERFTITQRGSPVAELVPYGVSNQRARAAAAEQLQTFMREQPRAEPIDTKALLAEGRD